MKTREEALADLLAPIVWHWSSRVRARQNLVVERHTWVRKAYPFMTEEEKANADAWFRAEAHAGLWD